MKCVLRSLLYSIATVALSYISIMMAIAHFYPHHTYGEIAVIDAIVSGVFLPISFLIFLYAERNR